MADTRDWLNGFVLHRRPFQDNSVLVDVFSLELGRVSAVVKHLRSQKSQTKSALLQPFQPIVFTLRGKTQLKSLTRVDSREMPIALTGQRLYCGFLCE